MPSLQSGAVGTIVMDLDGVVYHGNVSLPGAGDALETLSNRGWRLVLATNNSSKTPSDVVEKVRALTGYAAEVNHVVTSAMAAALHLTDGREAVFVVGEKALETALKDAGIEIVDTWQDAQAVVVGVDFDISYETIDRAARAIRGGARFVATNTDATFPQPDGLSVGSGAIVAAIATASETEPTVCGKPHQPMRQLVKRHIIGTDVWVVGDKPETDIAMAESEGWRSVLPLTGVTSSDIVASLSHDPDFIVASIEDVPAVIAQHARP